jgi:hypothetical protein
MTLSAMAIAIGLVIVTRSSSPRHRRTCGDHEHARNPGCRSKLIWR